MHELAVTQGILSTALDTAQHHGATRITAIYLTIGVLSSIVDDSVQFYFDVISRGTAAEGARLEFLRLPADARCLDCDNRFAANVPLPLACPACGSENFQVTGGQEFYVESIDVDEPGDDPAADQPAGS